ncbi:MAG: leucine-rich repeat domain-containing protein [Bacteroidota bacterium]
MKFRVACLWGIFLLGLSNLSGQLAQPDTSMLTEYKQQSRQLVRFLQFVMNTLGDPQTSRREKDIIINQSYLKIFDDPEVQVEDDLLPYRSVVTNKDVQAYLQDIDFFYEQVRFDLMIEEVSHSLLENGELFFTVRLNRRLQGINVSGDSINTLQERFIEINLDQENRLLKIASIYTQALSEDEALAQWWNELSLPWKEVFADELMVDEKRSMGDILELDLGAHIGDTLYALPADLTADSMRSSLSELFAEVEMDTVFLRDPILFAELKNLIQREELDLSTFPEIDELSPLSRMSRLRKLNISGTKVQDLSPIRNLTRLEQLNCSHTPVSSLAPMQYATALKEIAAHHTFLQNLEAVQFFQDLRILQLGYTPLLDINLLRNCPRLEELDLSYTRIRDLSPLQGSERLRNLRLTGTPVVNLGALSDLQALATLYIDHTGVAELSPLASLGSLRLLFGEGSRISDLQPLLQLPKLSKVYCDLTAVNQSAANQFMLARPEVLVVYESAALQLWWESLPRPWRTLFQARMEWGEEPEREALHQLANITSLDVSGQTDITELNPLQPFSQLQKLDCSNTSVASLEPLKDLVELKVLKLNGTVVAELEPLQTLQNLRTLGLSGTAIQSISALQGLTNLERLDISNTLIQDLLFLKDLENLRRLNAESTQVKDPQASQLLTFLPNLLLLYRGANLQSWWASLDSVWQGQLRQQLKLDDNPSIGQLHRLTSIEKVSLSGSSLNSLVQLHPFLRLKQLSFSDTQISDLSPLRKHKGLESLHLPRNPISDLSPIMSLINLQTLNVQNTPIAELAPITSLSSLERLNISGTQVRSLKALENLGQIRFLDCSSTDINNVKYLAGAKKMQQLICFNTRLSERKVDAFKLLLPDCEVVYY